MPPTAVMWMMRFAFGAKWFPPSAASGETAAEAGRSRPSSHAAAIAPTPPVAKRRRSRRGREEEVVGWNNFMVCLPYPVSLPSHVRLDCGPGGAEDCSHGWSDAPAQPGVAEPVVSSITFPTAPEGRRDRTLDKTVSWRLR